jgi:Peptidase family M28
VAAAARLAGYSVSFQDFEYPLDLIADWKAPILRVTSGDRRAFVPGIGGSLFGGDFGTMIDSPAGDLRDRQIFATDLTLPPPAAPSGSSGCEPADFTGMEAGAIVLLQRGTCAPIQAVRNAEAAGAGGMIWMDDWFIVTGAISIPMVSATPDTIADLANGVAQGPTGERGRLRVDWRSGTDPTKNVIAETRTGDPDNVIVVGAHLDSVGVGPGINDNGSGSAGILEIAEQLRRVHPRNKIRFIWFSAEESGLFGSEAYVASLSEEERSKIAAMLNFDMIGSPNFVRFALTAIRTRRRLRQVARRPVRTRSSSCSSTTSPTRAWRPSRPPSTAAPTTGPSSKPASRPVPLHRRRGDQDARAGGDLRRRRGRAVRPLLPPRLRPAYEPEHDGARADGGRRCARNDHTGAERRSARVRRG